MSQTLAHILVRIKLLSPKHRLAHLRALIRHEPKGSLRARALAALLRDQVSVASANEDRTV